MVSITITASGYGYYINHTCICVEKVYTFTCTSVGKVYTFLYTYLYLNGGIYSIGRIGYNTVILHRLHKDG